MKVLDDHKTDRLDAGIKQDPSDVFLFNQKQFIEAQGVPDGYLSLGYKKNGIIAGKVGFQLSGHTAVSPPKASFGGFDFNEYLEERELADFIRQSETYLQIRGYKKIVLRSFPACYHPGKFRTITGTLLNNGYKIGFVDVNQHIDLNDDFLTCWRSSEKAVLNNDRLGDFSFRQESSDRLAGAYEVIFQARRRKGYPVTMGLDELEKMFSKLPDHYFLFTLSKEDKIAAVAISILVAPDILYNISHADSDQFCRHSPTVVLVYHIAQFCQARDIKMLDLGISTEKGKLNHSLYRFKRHLGAVDSPKIFWQKEL